MIKILHGKDNFRRQLCLNQIKLENLEAGMEALNLVHAVNPSVVDFASLIQTPAFGFGKKVIILKDSKFLENKSEDADVEKILEALSSVPENNIVVFDSEKVSGTIKLVKRIKKMDSIEVQEFKPFSPWETKPAASWLCEIYKEINPEGAALKMPVAEHLAEHIGTEDSSKLYSELKRLVILAKPITVELINEECRAKHDLFKFIKELASANIPQANKELEKLILNKEAHLGLLSVMETQVSKYLKLKLAEKQGMSQNQQAELIGITPQRLYYQRQECARMKVEWLESLLERGLETERDVKTGRKTIENALRVLVNSN